MERNTNTIKEIVFCFVWLKTWVNHGLGDNCWLPVSSVLWPNPRLLSIGCHRLPLNSIQNVMKSWLKAWHSIAWPLISYDHCLRHHISQQSIGLNTKRGGVVVQITTQIMSFEKLCQISTQSSRFETLFSRLL